MINAKKLSGAIAALCLFGLTAAAPALAADTFSMDVDCAACHSKEESKMATEGFTGYVHKTLSCTMCHDDEEALTSAHSNKYSAKQATRVVALVHTRVDEKACMTCHASMLGVDLSTCEPAEEQAEGEAYVISPELEMFLGALAEKTADYDVLTDSNGTTVNPHALPEDHYGTKVNCSSCHKMHTAKAVDETATNACINCHHDNVYECGTCHAV